MRYLRRTLESQVSFAARSFPAVALTGPRRSGKTWLLRHLFPKDTYHLFEDPDVVSRFRHDPQGQGLEVDFVVPGKSGGVRLVEAKASRTVTPGDAAPMQRLAAAWSNRPGTRGRVEQMLVHRPARGGVASRAVATGVQALPWQEFLNQGLE